MKTDILACVSRPESPRVINFNFSEDYFLNLWLRDKQDKMQFAPAPKIKDIR